MTDKKRQKRLSRDSFAAILDEFLTGPCTATTLAAASGMGHRYVNALIRTLHAKRVVHIAGYEKDAIGRFGIKVWGLGPGRDAKRPTKPRTDTNREYRIHRERHALKGTPFYGLTV